MNQWPCPDRIENLLTGTLRIRIHIFKIYFRATNTYNINETCHAALGIQALQRVNNLYSLDGLDRLCQVKFAFRMETFVTKSFNPYKPDVLYLCIENMEITSDVKQQNTALNLMLFRFLSRFQLNN